MKGRQQLVRMQLNKILASLQPTIINVHNLHSATVAGWSSEMIDVCTKYAPVVWTLHDMWSFTGRCVYSHNCRKFLNGCDAACPTPTEYPALAPKKIAPAWRERQHLIAGASRLAAVTPSIWLGEEARAGLWSRQKVEVIPNGLPLDIYHPVDRGLARNYFGIKAEGPVLLVVSWSLNDWRKGGQLLIEAVKSISYRPLTIITMGEGQLPITAEGIHVHALGRVDDEQVKVLAYSVADMLVHPALMDNLPNVVMEAIACGVPVAGFPVGGVPDMVRPGQTGWLAPEVSLAGLMVVLQMALNDWEQGVDLRNSCRAVAEAEYGLELQAERYMTLFRNLIDQSPEK
jgi:glycosyltransferase involved in cell wall biosynthesis